MKNLGSKIKSLREEKNVSQEELAFNLNISQSKLSKIENGTTHTISFFLVFKLCKHFNVNFEYFTNSFSNIEPKNGDEWGGVIK